MLDDELGHWSTMRLIASQFTEVRYGATNRYLLAMGSRCELCRPVLMALLALSSYMGGTSRIERG